MQKWQGSIVIAWSQQGVTSNSIGLGFDFGAVLFIKPVGASDQAWGAIATLKSPPHTLELEVVFSLSTKS
jgi:hypothetical protein